VHQQDAYPTNTGGAVKTMHIIPAPFSMATSPSLLVCLYLAYSMVVNGNQAFLWEMAQFDPSQKQNPFTA